MPNNHTYRFSARKAGKPHHHHHHHSHHHPPHPPVYHMPFPPYRPLSPWFWLALDKKF